MCHFTGWTWDYTDETLTVSRLIALQTHWKNHPPAPVLIAAFMGMKPETSKENHQSKQDFFSLVQARPDITRKV